MEIATMHRALPSPCYQSGVIPYRWHAQQLEILLITSRHHARWIIPKGMIAPQLSPAESACREAYEEAGVRGSIACEAIGSYQCRKCDLIWTVLVFPFAVRTMLDVWPEMHERERRWFPVQVAAQQAAYADLRAVIAALPAALMRV